MPNVFNKFYKYSTSCLRGEMLTGLLSTDGWMDRQPDSSIHPTKEVVRGQ